MDDYKARLVARQIAITGEISSTNAQKIIKILKNKDLVKFSRILNQELEKQTVHVVSADEIDRETLTKLKSLFPNKQIQNTVDGKIGAGIQVQVYDMIYDLSVKSEIKRLAELAQEEI